MNHSVLIVDDDKGTLFSYKMFLSDSGYRTFEANSIAQARELISSRRFDAALLDVHLPDGKGMELIAKVRASSPACVIIMISGMGDIPLAVECMSRDADNFLTKPIDFGNLEIFLRKQIEVGSLRRRELTRELTTVRMEPFWGVSGRMQEVRGLLEATAGTDSSLMFTGETGTGKGILARWVHDHSPRATAPFVAVNCSGLRGELLASELFGHARGAFTSAASEKQGIVEYADGGTLFLDEIGDMDLDIQAQFLNVIEEKTFRRIGEVKDRISDFRLICATNRDLHKEALDGRFRTDLLYRINVVPVALPPLRQRIEDLPSLIGYLMETAGHGSAQTQPRLIESLSAYGWPGNIRELRNAIERALIFCPDGELKPEHFDYLLKTQSVSVKPKPQTAPAPSAPKSLREIEEAQIRYLIARYKGNRGQAANTLGISRATLYRRMKQYGLL